MWKLLRTGQGREGKGSQAYPSNNPRGCRAGRKAHREDRFKLRIDSLHLIFSIPHCYHLHLGEMVSRSSLAGGKCPLSDPENTSVTSWHSPDCWERCPLPFFFFSFFSFGLDKLKSRVGIWGCSSAALLVWFVVLSKWKVLFSLCVLERLFLLGETDSSASKCPCLGREGLFCLEKSSMLDWEETLASFSCVFDT